MKNVFSLSLILFSLGCYGQMKNDSVNNRIKELIKKNNDATITTEEKTELHAMGYNIQNKGFILEEQFHDYQNALAPIDSAISFWILTKDTANEANMRKYKGMLLGHLNRFEEGKSEINKAIELFKNLNMDYGIAVSKYDMSQLLDLEESIDSALVYQLDATNFWINKKDTLRMIINNNQLIHLYCKKGLYQKAEQIQRSNELIYKPDLHWNPKINFYYVSYKLFALEGDDDKAGLYKKLYFDELHELKGKGIKIKSGYDEE